DSQGFIRDFRATRILFAFFRVSDGQILRSTSVKPKTTKRGQIMNRTNIKQHLPRTLSALVVIAALFTLPKTQAGPPASAHGFSNDCESLISEQHHGSNTIIVLSISATFTGTFDGTWVGTERDVIHGDGSVALQGSGVFAGSVSGRSGTMVFTY